MKILLLIKKNKKYTKQICQILKKAMCAKFYR